jgi:Alginate lyase
MYPKPSGRFFSRVFQLCLHSFFMICLGASAVELPTDFPRTEAGKQAEQLLTHVIGTVVDKGFSPPSGDKHDWVSQAPYWWKDRANPLGPYIRHDGKRNPEIDRWTDEKHFSDMLRTCEVLSQGYVATQDERFAKRIAEILRSWFIDPNTKMNPNLDYGQFVPGRSTGRGEGMIATRFIYKIPQIIHRIESSSSWTPEDQLALDGWFQAYYDWITNSRLGIEEAKHENNHLTWYLVQKAALEIQLKKLDAARKTFDFVLTRVIPSQIDHSGLQPKELERTKSFSYSSMNLNAFWVLAFLGKGIGIDFLQNENGKFLLAATDALLPYDDLSRWPYPQISKGAEKDACRAFYWVQYFSKDIRYAQAQMRFQCPESVESYFIKHGL